MIYAIVALIIYAILVYRSGYTILRPDGTKYLTRWYFLLGAREGWRKIFPCSAFLHHFHASDARERHNHPWAWSYSLILKGGYVETRPDWDRLFTAGMINSIKGDDFHYVTLLDEKKGCWTLFIAGPSHKKGWGFQGPNGFEPAEDRIKNTLSKD
jgi:hypothetical protein